MPQLRIRFWLETSSAVASIVALVLTLLSHGWIEWLVRVEPDRGTGALEWVIVAALLCSTICMSSLAGTELRRAVSAAG